MKEVDDNIAKKSFSFKKYAWRSFKKNKPAYYSLWVLAIVLLLYLLSPIIATDQPLYAKYRGKTFYPAFEVMWNPTKTDSTKNPESGNWEKFHFANTDWKQLQLDMVPYQPHQADIFNSNFKSPTDKNRYKSPEGNIKESPYVFRHHFGTDVSGKDVLSGLIHGAGVSLKIALFAMLIATVIGLVLGAFAGYFGDNKIKISKSQVIWLIASIFLGYFYAFSVRKYALADALSLSPLYGLWHLFLSMLVFICVVGICLIIGKFLEFGALKKKVFLPLDSIISRGIELLNSLPRILLIITLAAIVEKPSIWLLIAIIGLTSWTQIARLTRAEILQIRELEYISAAKSLGYSQFRIIFKHALPNALAPVFVSVAFGIASAILIESALSFLGIGVPPDEVTWGSLLSAGRQEFDAWWLVVFPGLAIFITVTAFNLIGEGMRDAFDPKLKQ